MRSYREKMFLFFCLPRVCHVHKTLNCKTYSTVVTVRYFLWSQLAHWNKMCCIKNINFIRVLWKENPGVDHLEVHYQRICQKPVFSLLEYTHLKPYLIKSSLALLGKGLMLAMDALDIFYSFRDSCNIIKNIELLNAPKISFSFCFCF